MSKVRAVSPAPIEEEEKPHLALVETGGGEAPALQAMQPRQRTRRRR